MRIFLAREWQIGQISTFQGREASLSQEVKDWLVKDLKTGVNIGNLASQHSNTLPIWEESHDRFGSRALPCTTETREGAHISSPHPLMARTWACDLKMANHILPGTLNVEGVMQRCAVSDFSTSYCKVKNLIVQQWYQGTTGSRCGKY